MSSSPTLAKLASDLEAAHPPVETVCLGLGDWSARIETNSAQLATQLRKYFGPFLTEQGEMRILALECDPPEFGVQFADWPREPGKSGRKEEFADVQGGRIIRKVRTGMQFLLGPGIKVALGPCVENDNQVHNFTNTQLINWLLEHNWALCHAAGVVYRGKGLMFAGLAGGGKSTLSLHLMSKSAKFTSNDRMLIRREGNHVRMAGVPKLPRINPGTILNNPDLEGTIPPARVAELKKLSKDELWKLEEKYDADIETCFGKDRFAPTAMVDALTVLNWDRNATEPTRLTQVNLLERDDLMGAVMKSPGPFHETAKGEHPDSKPDVNPDQYVEHVKQMRAYELTGKADFGAAVELVEQMIDG
jgi:HprK-related kinase B